jgi:hypothetical protein
MTPELITSIGTLIIGLLGAWWKVQQERSRTSAAREDATRLVRERDKAITEGKFESALREQLAVQIARLEQDKRYLTALNDWLMERVPREARPAADTSLMGLGKD